MLQAKYESDNSGSGPSGGIWWDCPWSQMVADPNLGYTFFDDFLGWPAVAAGTVAQSGYTTFADTGGTITSLATEVGGVIRLATDATDNDSVALGTENLGKISSTTPKKLWWEARIRATQITTQNLYIGLTEEGNCIDNGVIADAGTISNQDYVGFRVLEADPDGLDSIHNDATGEVVVENESQVLVAATWYKVGCRFDGEKTYWYIDGVQQGLGVLPTATDFPDGEEMGLLFLIKNSTTTAISADMDWWRFAQER